MNQMFVSLYNESLVTHSFIQFAHSGQCLTQSELSIRLKNLCAELETKQHTHSFLIYYNERERESCFNVRLDCPLSAFLVTSEETNSALCINIYILQYVPSMLLML